MIKFFLERRVLTNLITFFIIIVGGYQFLNVRREAFPEIDFDIITINTAYPSASPEDVERLVTRRIEDQLRGVSGIDRVESYSVENQSSIVVRLDEELTDRQIDRAVNDVEQAVGRVQDLPALADKPIVSEMTSDRPLITLSVAGGTPEVRHDFAEEMKIILEEIDGVSRVDRLGWLKPEIWIEADREKLTAAQLTLGEVAAAVRGQNVDASAGAVEAGENERWVRVVGGIKTAEDVAGIIVRGTDARSYIRVRDVAAVRETFEDPRMLTKANGRPGIDLNVRKVRTGDTIKLAQAVRDVRAQYMEKARAKDLDLIVSDDWSFFIKRRLRVMTSNLLQGGVLILIALFIFLDWRLAMVAAWGVPISFATAFMVAVPLGFTINLLSLMGLIIVMGILDDDSVVVAENIYRHLEMGKTPFQAALDGAREVVIPVMGSVASTACAFLPFALVSGIMGKFLLMIPVIVILCFAASVFEAFFILPSHVIDLMPLGKPVEESHEGRWYAAIVRGYRRFMGWVLSHRLKFFMLVLLFIALTALLASWRLRFNFFPRGLIDQVLIQIDMPRGTGLTETEKALRRVEEAVLSLPAAELESATAVVGQKGMEENIRMGTHYGQVRVFFTPEESRPRSTEALVDLLRKQIGRIPGVEKIVFTEIESGPPVGSAILVRARGRDPKTVGEIADVVKKEMRAIQGVTDVTDSREGGKDQLRYIINTRDAAFANVHLARIAENIQYAVGGAEVSEVRRAEVADEIKIRLRLLPEQRTDPSEVLRLPVLNDQGRPVPMSSVARVETSQGPPFLQHYNFMPAVSVSGDVQEDVVSSQEANARLRKVLADIPKQYPGYELIYGGEEEETQKSIQSLFRAFGIAVLLIFVILATLFKSYVKPAVILLTIPIGLLGAAYALILHGKPASFMALLGVVAMTGVVVNNAIVLVSFIMDREAEGMSTPQAAIEAGAVRLRPIWASSITTLLGLFPTAYGFGGYEPFVAPMALSLAWGLAFAMPLTMILIPMAYTLADDASRLWARASAPVARGIANLVRGITLKKK